MKISVAMCTYNGARFLPMQLQSIREQTHSPYELIVCDDGSTDDSIQLIESFASAIAFPVRLVKNKVTLRSTKNFEQAIRLCTGDAIALCDQDDCWMANKLERVASVLKSDPGIGGVFTDATLMDEDGKSISGSLWQRFRITPARQRAVAGHRASFALLNQDMATGATLVFRSHYVDQVVPISPAWIHDAWIAVVLTVVSRIVAIPEPLICYRLHSGQQSGATIPAWTEHLHTAKQEAIAAHWERAERWAAIAERLESLHAPAALMKSLHQKIKFLSARARLLEQPRGRRLALATAQLPGYMRFSKGIVSYFRDLAH